jgi:hypothetical protein
MPAAAKKAVLLSGEVDASELRYAAARKWQARARALRGAAVALRCMRCRRLVTAAAGSSFA